MTLNTIDLTLDRNRKAELREDIDYVHIMKYMGSKRELLPNIRESVSSIVPLNSTILDLFAGTASVGTYLKNNYNVFTNDIQKYSQIISDALIASSSIELPSDQQLLLFNIEKEYVKNKEALIKKFASTYHTSNEFVSIKKNEWTDVLRKEYISFFESFPSPTNDFQTKSKELAALTKMYFQEHKKKKKTFPYFQTTFLFSETYFSFEQAIDIDSIRYAIDETIKNDLLKSIYLAALMFAYSYTSSGTGHFAMFRDIADVNSIEDVFNYRKKRVWDFFTKKLDELLAFHKYLPTKKYKSFTEDFSTILDSDIMKGVNLVYADPPYSFVHYSRFYHAVESLIKYDYDLPSHKGRYRSDRHQSPFCQRSNVEKAFNTLFEKSKKHNANVLLSYSDTGMISLERIKELILQHGFKYEAESIIYDHSTLGRKGHKSNKISEYLIKAII